MPALKKARSNLKRGLAPSAEGWGSTSRRGATSEHAPYSIAQQKRNSGNDQFVHQIFGEEVLDGDTAIQIEVFKTTELQCIDHFPQITVDDLGFAGEVLRKVLKHVR